MQNEERPMIPFQGSYTKEMVQCAIRATMAGFRLAPWFLGFALVVSMFGVVIVPIQHGEPAGEVLRSSLPGLVFMGILLALFLWIPRASSGRQLTTNKLLQEPMEGYVSEKGVYMSTPRSTVDLPWDTLYRAKVTDKVILLGGSEVQYYMLPREFFASDEDWRRVCAWVEAKVPKPKEPRLVRLILVWMVIFVLVILLWNFIQTP